MKNPKVGKVKMGKQIIYHVTAPMSGQFLKSRSDRSAIFSDFGCKKMGLGMPKSKNGGHFLSPTIPKNGGIDFCFTRISFSGEFWANFENRVFLANFWPLSHCKIVKRVRAISQKTNGWI